MRFCLIKYIMSVEEVSDLLHLGGVVMVGVMALVKGPQIHLLSVCLSTKGFSQSGVIVVCFWIIWFCFQMPFFQLETVMFGRHKICKLNEILLAMCKQHFFYWCGLKGVRVFKVHTAFSTWMSADILSIQPMYIYIYIYISISDYKNISAKNIIHK